ncbi:hypothetical protein BH09MYX1_BH09MYX1_11360 [soil metagenome]
MKPGGANLKDVATTVLAQIRDAVASNSLKTPIDRTTLIAFGIRHQVVHDALERALAGHRSAACLAVLEVVLAERTDLRPPPELVWTGPEGPAGTARDTAVVLRALFEEARESVILAGYSFDHARDVLAPLHRAMKDHGVDVRFFVDVKQALRPVDSAEYLEAELGSFLANNWPFGDPRPRVYYDKRALQPGPPWCSMHAKCVVVDGRRAFVSSANFTQRGQERNIEVGVKIEDPSFASFLAGQWMGLVEAGIVGEYCG